MTSQFEECSEAQITFMYLILEFTEGFWYPNPTTDPTSLWAPTQTAECTENNCQRNWQRKEITILLTTSVLEHRIQTRKSGNSYSCSPAENFYTDVPVQYQTGIEVALIVTFQKSNLQVWIFFKVFH